MLDRMHIAHRIPRLLVEGPLEVIALVALARRLAIVIIVATAAFYVVVVVVVAVVVEVGVVVKRHPRR